MIKKTVNYEACSKCWAGHPAKTQVQRQYTMFENARVSTLDGGKTAKVGKNLGPETTAESVNFAAQLYGGSL